MRLWPFIAAAGFVTLGIALRAWNSRGAALYWLRAWSLWTIAAFFAGDMSSAFVKGLGGQASEWQRAWSSLSWQLDFWFAASLPVLLAFSLELRAPGGSFSKTRLAVALGAGLGPLAMGAFPLQQVAAFSAPLLLLALALRWLPGARRSFIRFLGCLAALNLLGLMHGLWMLPALAGSLALGAVLALGMNPYGWKAGLSAFALAAMGIALKARWGLAGPAPTLAVCALIVLGWILNAPPPENELAQTP